MITARQAYYLIKMLHPGAKASNDVYDYGDFYVFDTSLDRDRIKNNYKIDKKTGEVTEIDFHQLCEETKHLHLLSAHHYVDDSEYVASGKIVYIHDGPGETGS